MCGITGFIDFRGRLNEVTLQRMTASLHHRGPDGSGQRLETVANARVGLGHARLSVLDLSTAGQQPMRLGPYAITYNGEIYNFRELRRDLERIGHVFQSDGDTEVILHAFAEWGIACLDRFIGMFAFALLDSATQRLFLVRDRIGVKPLYVHVGSDAWMFGSELKAIRACPEFPAKLSEPDLHAFFRHGHVPDEGCIYQDCWKVDAGTYWMVDLAKGTHRRVRWWDATRLHDEPKLAIGFEEAADALDGLLQSACGYRLVSDVPVGVFLSGGYDSTAVAAIVQAQASRPIKTFTIGFTEGNDEAPFARETARRLGTDHHELYCSPGEAMDAVVSLADVYDEPFADSSAIPTLLVSRLARASVKVALSADGGDELFCGYASYPDTARRLRRLERIPTWLRGPAGVGLRTCARLIPGTAYATRHKASVLGHALVRDDALMAQRLHGYARLMPRGLVDRLLPGVAPDRGSIQDRTWPPATHPLEAAMGLDYQTYLKDDIMAKVDRATMSVGLEGREPLLDHRLAQFAARLPLEYKYDGRTTKRILKHVVHRYVPEALMDRPKSGFSLPIMAWMRKDLLPLVNETCSATSLKDAGVIDARVGAEWLSAFMAGRFHYTPLIWRLFVFLAWKRRWLD